MKQNGKLVRIALIFIGIIILAVFAITRSGHEDKNCNSMSDQSAKDDCYHAIAHKTNNIGMCDKILDSEKKEHCYGHVPH